MVKPSSLLVLDEPTNHLDIPSKEMLEVWFMFSVILWFSTVIFNECSGAKPHDYFNHLMIYQEAINEYQGTVITVSHDRYFIKQIVNRVVEDKDSNLQDYAGDYNVSPPPSLFSLKRTA